MTVINLMLGKKRGGIEQSVIDYAEALMLAGIEARNIVAPQGWAAGELKQRGIPFETLRQCSGMDLLAAWKLRRMKASAIICHGNRALSLALRGRGTSKVIAITHNEKTKRFPQADAIFAVTEISAETLRARGVAAERIHRMPNTVRIGDLPKRPDYRIPPVIGSMGRFVPKKGFEVLVDALAILNQESIAFTAIIGGGGDGELSLRDRIARYGLQDRVTLPGWVDDKDAFFQGLDLFVLPSHDEPFGIVVLEAMAAGLPIIATATEGPREIIEDGSNGRLFPIGDAAALADRLRNLLANEKLGYVLGVRGHAHAANQYSLANHAARLKTALQAILTGN